MNRITQGFIGAGLTVTSFGIGGGEKLQAASSLPAGCTVYEVGHPVNKGAETALVAAGFAGITPDGAITDTSEQPAVYQAQLRMKEIGILEAGTKICGYAGDVTRRAAELFFHADDLASDADAVEVPAAQPNVRFDDCEYKVITKLEVARLLGNSGLESQRLCEEVDTFQRQHGLAPDHSVGPMTARALIEKAANPCNIYGTTVDDCVVGMQNNGNLGRVYVVEDGDIIKSFSARFGNATRSRGKKTPEGQFGIQRTIEGEHISENCVDANGNGYVCMWNSLYFSGGKAIHGTTGPNNPNGSLGCVGVSIENSAFIYAQYEEGNVKKIVIVDFQRPAYKQAS